MPIFEIAMPPEEAARLRAAAESLERFIRAADGFFDRHPPDPESPVGLASETDGGAWWVSAAQLQLSCASDHLFATVTLLRGTLQRYAPFTVMRGAFEAANRAWWLLDSSVSPEVRVARGLTERLHNVRTRGQLSNEDISERLAAVAVAAERLGVRQFLDRRGELLAYGDTERPKHLALAGMVLPTRRGPEMEPDGAWTYRLLSGNAHAEIWALLANAKPVRNPRDGTVEHLMSINVSRLLHWLWVVAIAYEKASRRRVLVSGLSLETWDAEVGDAPTL